MTTYFIPASVVFEQARKEACSFIQPPQCKPNELLIFNKNSLNFQRFINVRKAMDRYGYIGEADVLDPHFRLVIREE